MRRHAPSIGIGLGLSLRTSIAVFVNYFKVGRALDLFTNFFSSDTSIADQSGEGNDAIPYTGRYVYTDGSNDKAINANCSALGASTYKLTGKIRSTSTGAKVATIGGQAISYTVLAANAWEDFETSVTTSVAPSAVIVGWDGTSTFTGADWSDVRLIDTARSETVIPRWQLNDHSDDTTDGLNGKVALDSSGNGYNGSHVGCTGATGEGIDPDVARIVGYDDAQWFNGEDTSLDYGSPLIPATADFDETFTIYVGHPAAPSDHIYWFSQGTTAPTFFGVGLKSSGIFTLNVGGIDQITETAAGRYLTFITIRLVRVSGTFEMFFDGESKGTFTSAISLGQTNSIWGNSPWLGSRNVTGLIQGDSVTGTPSGDFLTVGQKRETILQTAGMDWNKNTTDYATTVLVPVSEADPTLDAIGTAIANPRPNNKVLNLFEEGEFVELPDVASLEDVRSITLAVYNDGTTKDILQAAAGASFVDIAANVLQTDQSGTHAYYVGGAATTTLAAGWNIVGITFDAAKDLSGGKIVATSGNLLAYDPNALTLADQLQNSTAFSPSYGL